ncbi:MAG: hypothetical protein ACLUL2_12020 [Blautia sp.]
MRAVYLYAGMTDMARITQDESLYHACEKLWDSMVERKMYVGRHEAAHSQGGVFPLTMTCRMTRHTRRPAQPSALYFWREECWRSSLFHNMRM